MTNRIGTSPGRVLAACLLSWVCACFALGGASAQDLPDPDRPVASRSASNEPVTIGVFGDSIADGLWVGLRWQLRDDPRIDDIVQLSEVSTGFANWTYRDVAAKTADQLSEGRYEIAVVMFGSNDMQGIRDGAGRVHRFRSASWEEVYRERVRTVLGQLHDHGAQVIWVGLPVMRSTGYDANVRHLNSIFEEEAEAAGAVYVSVREVSSNAEGAYSGYLETGSGVPRLMRADDGIHFTLPGYRRIAAPVAAVVDAALADPEIGRPRPSEPEAAPWESLVRLYIEGEPYICTPASEAEIDAVLVPEARASRP